MFAAQCQTAGGATLELLPSQLVRLRKSKCAVLAKQRHAAGGTLDFSVADVLMSFSLRDFVWSGCHVWLPSPLLRLHASFGAFAKLINSDCSTRICNCVFCCMSAVADLILRLNWLRWPVLWSLKCVLWLFTRHDVCGAIPSVTMWRVTQRPQCLHAIHSCLASFAVLPCHCAQKIGFQKTVIP